MFGTAETREQAAQGLGELIDVTSEKTLKEFVVQITGPLIRILSDRFPWQVKDAILSTLNIIISKGGISLKPFVPQLQTTFLKCLQDNNRSVRTSSASGLGMLSALSSRVDPLVSDLLSMLQSSEDAVKEAVLAALKGVVKHAGKSISKAVRLRGCILLKEMIQIEDNSIRGCAAKVVGMLSQYMEDGETSELVRTLFDLSSSPSWFIRHGSLLAFSSMSVHCPSVLCHSLVFATLLRHLGDALKDDQFLVRETAAKALGRLLVYQIQHEANTLELIQLLILAMNDDSSEVRRRSLSCIKAAAKVNPLSLSSNLSILGPAIAECLKDGSASAVRLAAERCALHVFQLTKGADNVQAAQKYISGLDARRLAKLPQESDDSQDSDDERPGRT